MSAARSRLEHAISEGQLLSSLDNASSIRDLLGQQDLQAKTFLKNLTRFHRLKQRLDAVAGDILSAAFLNDARYASRPADLLQPPGDLDAQLARGKEALEPLSNVVARAVEAAGLDVAVVSGAGSGNYVLAATLGGVTEVQAGGACFQCATYEATIGAGTGKSLQP